MSVWLEATTASINDLFIPTISMQSPHRAFLIRCSYIEIYNEKIGDLLASDGRTENVEVRESKERVRLQNCRIANECDSDCNDGHTNARRQRSRMQGVYVDASEVVISTADDILRALQTGERKRRTAETGMNARSSRSHAIFRIIIESRPTGDADSGDGSGDAGDAPAGAEQATPATGSGVLMGTLSLVDLAGSESMRGTGATGERQREAGNINKSLLTLARVIKELANKSRGGAAASSGHVAFRESKLTRVLQPSLDGNTRLAVIACISPARMYLEETRSTLSFAASAKEVKLAARPNEVSDDAAQMKRMARELAALRAQLKEAQERAAAAAAAASAISPVDDAACITTVAPVASMAASASAAAPAATVGADDAVAARIREYEETIAALRAQVFIGGVKPGGGGVGAAPSVTSSPAAEDVQPGTGELRPAAAAVSRPVIDWNSADDFGGGAQRLLKTISLAAKGRPKRHRETWCPSAAGGAVDFLAEMSAQRSAASASANVVGVAAPAQAGNTGTDGEQRDAVVESRGGSGTDADAELDDDDDDVISFKPRPAAAQPPRKAARRSLDSSMVFRDSSTRTVDATLGVVAEAAGMSQEHDDDGDREAHAGINEDEEVVTFNDVTIAINDTTAQQVGGATHTNEELAASLAEAKALRDALMEAEARAEAAAEAAAAQARLASEANSRCDAAEKTAQEFAQSLAAAQSEASAAVFSLSAALADAGAFRARAEAAEASVTSKSSHVEQLEAEAAALQLRLTSLETSVAAAVAEGLVLRGQLGEAQAAVVAAASINSGSEAATVALTAALTRGDALAAALAAAQSESTATIASRDAAASRAIAAEATIQTLATELEAAQLAARESAAQVEAAIAAAADQMLAFEAKLATAVDAARADGLRAGTLAVDARVATAAAEAAAEAAAAGAAETDALLNAISLVADASPGDSDALSAAASAVPEAALCVRTSGGDTSSSASAVVSATMRCVGRAWV